MLLETILSLRMESNVKGNLTVKYEVVWLVIEYCDAFSSNLIFSSDWTVHLHVPLWVCMRVCLEIFVLLAAHHLAHMLVFVRHTEGSPQCWFLVSLSCLSVWGGTGIVLSRWGGGKLFLFLVSLVFVDFGVRSVSFTFSLQAGLAWNAKKDALTSE